MTLPARHCTAGINLREYVLLHRQAQKTFPVWRQREALPCGLEALHQALTAQTSSLDHWSGGRKCTPPCSNEHPGGNFWFIKIPFPLSNFTVKKKKKITQLVLFFSCLIAWAPNPIEKLSWLIYTEQLFRLKATAPFKPSTSVLPCFSACYNKVLSFKCMLWGGSIEM